MVAEVFAHFLEVKLRDEALELVALVVFGLARELEYRADIVFDGHLAEYRCVLGQVADAGLCTLVHGVFGDVEVVEVDAAFVGGDEAGGHVEGGGLAGAVRAEQPDYLSLGHVD